MQGYKGICARFGGHKRVMVTTLASSVVLNSIFNAHSFQTEQDMINSSSVAMTGGALGAAMASLAHRRLNVLLAEAKIGKTKGAEIVQKTQLAIGAFSVAAFIIFNTQVSDGIKNLEKEFFSQTEIKVRQPNSPANESALHTLNVG